MPEVNRLKFVLRVGKNVGSKCGQVLYRAWVNCDDAGVPFQCSAEECEREVLYDCWYCEECLRSKCGVYIAPSKTGFGLGLFSSRLVKRGKRIVHYGGEIISDTEMHTRYGWMKDDNDEYYVVTAPYALGLSDSEESRDAVRIRGAGSYCNSPRGTAYEANARLGNRYVRAIKTIQPDEEIFVKYGEAYWGSSSADTMTHTTVRVSQFIDEFEEDRPRKCRKIEE